MTKQKKFSTASAVRQRYGGMSDMTLYRWLQNPTLGFPRPRYINGRRYFDDDELDAFDARMADAKEPATSESA